MNTDSFKLTEINFLLGDNTSKFELPDYAKGAIIGVVPAFILAMILSSVGNASLVVQGGSLFCPPNVVCHTTLNHLIKDVLPLASPYILFPLIGGIVGATAGKILIKD